MNCFLYFHTSQLQEISLLVGRGRNAEKLQRCSVNTIASYSGTKWSDWTRRSSSSPLHLFVIGHHVSILNFWISHTESVYLYCSLVYSLKKWDHNITTFLFPFLSQNRLYIRFCCLSNTYILSFYIRKWHQFDFHCSSHKCLCTLWFMIFLNSLQSSPTF